MNQDKSSDKAKKRFDNRSDYISSRSHKAWKPSPPVKAFVPADSPLMQEARQLRLKRRFSQNFLINATVLKKIAMLQDLQPGDTVLEIGAGSGFLTDALLHTGAKVTAVELDSGMCWYLKRKFQKQLGLLPDSTSKGPIETSLRLVEGDFLKLEPSVMEIPVTDTEPSVSQCPERFKVVGNLPYGITSKILFKLIGELEDFDHAWRSRISQLTFMVQKEVAERITAKPGEKAYNNLSIAMQMRCHARLEFIVPSRDFYPAPKVDSAIISLTPREESLIPPEKIVAFSKLVQAAFAAKRKTLKNSLLLRKFATPEQIDAAFVQSGIDPRSRAEALSIQEFGALTDAFGIHPG